MGQCRVSNTSQNVDRQVNLFINCGVERRNILQFHSCNTPNTPLLSHMSLFCINILSKFGVNLGVSIYDYVLLIDSCKYLTYV